MKNKAEVIDHIIEHIDQKALEIGKAIDERLEAMREAETRNQSRYDTKGWEAAREAEGASQVRATLEKQKQFFLQLRQRSSTATARIQRAMVTPGSLVEIRNSLGESKWIFLVTCAGGIEVQDVVVVSTSAPIADRLIMAKANETILLPDGAFVVSQIQ
jgi:transcription elongation GreA/GreB family factor